MRTVSVSILGLALVSAAVLAAEPAIESDEQKTLYALGHGLAMSQQLAMFDFSAADLALIQAGLADAVLERESRADLSTFGPKIGDLLRGRLAAAADKEKVASRPFEEAAAKEPGAVKTDSGLIYRELEAGQGASPASTDRVRIHYKGSFRDGKVFDSSSEANEPATLQLDQVVTCFSEGIGRMKVGGKAKLVCPPALTYGDSGLPPRIPPGSTLAFEVQLLEIVPPQAPPPAGSEPGSEPGLEP